MILHIIQPARTGFRHDAIGLGDFTALEPKGSKKGWLDGLPKKTNGASLAPLAFVRF